MLEPTCRFLVIGMQRSGTTVTHQCLRGHPEIALPQAEIKVHPLFTLGMASFGVGPETHDIRGEGFRTLFDVLTRIGSEPAARAIGMKLALRHASEAADLANSLREYFPDMRIVHVVRGDLVAQCGSGYRAERTGVWHKVAGDGEIATEKIAIPDDEFDAYVRNAQELRAHIDLLRETHDFLEFRYEEDIASGLRWQRLFEFLGVTPVEPSWITLKKVAPAPDSYIEGYAARTKRAARFPPVTADDVRRIAVEREACAAADEHPRFLYSRALSRIDRGLKQRAFADAAAAVRTERQIDLTAWLAGGIAAALEATADAADAQETSRELLGRLEARFGETENFRLSRGDARLRHGLVEGAAADVAAALSSEESPPPDRVKWALGLLRKCAFGGAPAALMRSMIDPLRARYGDIAEFESLERALAIAGGARKPAPAERPFEALEVAEGQLRAGHYASATTLALQALEHGCELRPADIEWAFHILEQGWRKQNDLAAAEAGLARLRGRYAETATFHLLVALVAAHAGRRDEAAAAIRRSEALDPSHAQLATVRTTVRSPRPLR